MTKQTLMDWAKAHCSEYIVEYRSRGSSITSYCTYMFNWGGYTYQLSINSDEDGVYFDRVLVEDVDDYFSLSLSLEEVVISDDKLYIAAIPQEFYR